MKILHIYGQECWHDDVHIVGTKEALEELCTHIKIAIDTGKATTSREDSIFVNDGEGYSVNIAVLNKEDCEKLSVPYSDDVAQEKQEERFKFFRDLIRKLFYDKRTSN